MERSTAAIDESLERLTKLAEELHRLKPSSIVFRHFRRDQQGAIVPNDGEIMAN